MALNQLRQLPGSLYFLFAGTMITRMGAFVFPYLTIYLSESRNYGFETVGMILSVGSIGLLGGNFAGGVLTDKWSRKWTLIVALLLNAIGFAGLAFQYEAGWLYAAMLLIGYFGSGMYGPAANTVIADLAPEEVRPFAYTTNYFCVNLGMGMGPLIGGFLAEVSYNWIFIGDVITSLVCALLIFIGVAETRHARTLQPTTKLTTLRPKTNIWWRHRNVLAFSLVYFFLIAPLMGMEYAVPLLVKKTFGAPLFYVGIIYSINAACILTFSFAIEKFIRNQNEYRMMVLSGFIWTTGMSVLLFGFSVPALMVCTAIWTIGEIIASILVPSFIAKHVAAEYKGRFMAINDLVRSFAGVICPIGLGFIWKFQSASSVVLTITLLPVVGIACYSILLLMATSSAIKGTAAKLEVPQ